jgi:uncharacterized membrane protein
MTKFLAVATIERPADDVWAYAADIARHPDWMTVTDARVVRGTGTQTGARGRERIRFGPFGWDAEFEVVEAERGRRIVWKAVDGVPFDLAVSLDLELAGTASTKATYAADLRLHGLWRLLGPMVAIEGKAGPERELRRLKAQVEEAPGIAATMS